MPSSSSQWLSLMYLLVSLLFVSGVTSRNFTIENKCDYTVWPGIRSSTKKLSTTGFALKKGETRVLNAPSSWIGSFWGRTICSTSSTGNFSSATGDCSSGSIECSGAGASPPTTLAEFGLDGDYGQDFYDVSLAEGYNLPLVVVPQRSQSGQKCLSICCVVNLNKTCPSELMVMGSSGEEEPIACMSACQKFKTAEFCCRGKYSAPEKCKPSLYNKNFKNECPLAYSYVYDDATSTFTCSNSPNYVITFCPPITPNLTNNNRSSAAESPIQLKQKMELLNLPQSLNLPRKLMEEQKKLYCISLNLYCIYPRQRFQKLLKIVMKLQASLTPLSLKEVLFQLLKMIYTFPKRWFNKLLNRVNIDQGPPKLKSTGEGIF